MSLWTPKRLKTKKRGSSSKDKCHVRTLGSTGLEALGGLGSYPENLQPWQKQLSILPAWDQTWSWEKPMEVNTWTPVYHTCFSGGPSWRWQLSNHLTTTEPGGSLRKPKSGARGWSGCALTWPVRVSGKKSVIEQVFVHHLVCARYMLGPSESDCHSTFPGSYNF